MYEAFVTSCTIYGNVLYNVLYIEIISVPFFINYFVYSVQYMYDSGEYRWLQRF